MTCVWQSGGSNVCWKMKDRRTPSLCRQSKLSMHFSTFVSPRNSVYRSLWELRTRCIDKPVCLLTDMWCEYSMISNVHFKKWIKKARPCFKSCNGTQRRNSEECPVWYLYSSAHSQFLGRWLWVYCMWLDYTPSQMCSVSELSGHFGMGSRL